MQSVNIASPRKVLLIDDCESIHALLKVRLRGEPVQIVSAYDGESGLSLARTLTPDLILLDVEMPGLDGFEVCRRLKADPETMGTLIIFLSGLSSTEEKIKGLDLGAVDYIAKPFDPAELKARVRASLRTKFLLDLLSTRAMIDGLTGLWNRAYFDQRLEAEASLATRSGRALSCLLFDVDHFKNINDTHGHGCGDEALREVAATLTDALRAEDVTCRYGGEEFVALLPNTTLEGAGALAERLRRTMAERSFKTNSASIRVTCSGGVAAFSGDAAMMVEQADQALYQAKQTGRDRIVVWEKDTPARRRAG